MTARIVNQEARINSSFFSSRSWDVFCLDLHLHDMKTRLAYKDHRDPTVSWQQPFLKCTNSCPWPSSRDVPLEHIIFRSEKNVGVHLSRSKHWHARSSLHSYCICFLPRVASRLKDHEPAGQGALGGGWLSCTHAAEPWALSMHQSPAALTARL